MIPEAAVEAKQGMIDAALKIHSPYGQQVGRGLRWVDPKCRECDTRWPCKTTLALTSQVRAHLATGGPA